MKQVELREGAKRQHRMIALFAALQCWLRDVDGLCIERNHLQRLIGLEKFKGTRMTWLKADFAEMFPYQKVLVYKGGDTFASFYISRKKFALPNQDTSMTDEERISQMPKESPKFGIFQYWPAPEHGKAKRMKKSFQALTTIFADNANFDERLMTSYLSLIIHGQISARAVIESIVAKKRR